MIKQFLLCLAIIVAGLTASVYAQAGCPGGTCTVGSCEFAAVNTAINTTAVNGNTVVIGQGDCTWPVGGISVTKSLVIRGAGVDLTIIRTTAEPTNLPQGNVILFNWSPTGTGVHVIENLTLRTNVDRLPAAFNGMIQLGGNAGNVIIRNIKIACYRGRGINTVGDARGVVTGLTYQSFAMPGFGQGCTPGSYHHYAWNSVGSFGDNSWANAHTMGALGYDSGTGRAQNLMFEDCTMQGLVGNYNGISDADGGGRFGIRFCKVIDTQIVEHGLDSPERIRGTRQQEFYRNILTNTTFSGAMSSYRSGTGFIFDNYLTASGNGAGALIEGGHHYRPAIVNQQFLQRPWNFCGARTLTQISCSGGVATATGVPKGSMTHLGVNFPNRVEIAGSTLYDGVKNVLNTPTLTTFTFAASCVGTASAGGMVMRSPWDTPTLASGWPCIDQLGRGAGNLISGDGHTTSPATPVNQAMEPVYSINNKKNGVVVGGTQWGSGEIDNSTLTFNREIFQSFGASCSGGTCSTGIGRGPRSSRPAACVSFTAWWATDSTQNWNQETAAMHNAHDPSSLTHTLGEDGALDKCVGTFGQAGSWVSDAMVPLAYPHPLLGGVPPPPGNAPPTVTITSHVDNTDTFASTATLGGNCIDDVVCATVTYTCTLATTGGSCGQGSAVGVNPWSITGVTIPSGISTWTITGTDGDASPLNHADTIRFYRVAAATLPHTESFTVGASAVWPGYGSNWTQVGGPQHEINSQRGRVSLTGFNGLLFTGIGLNADQQISALAITFSPFAQQIRFCLTASGSPSQTSNFDAYVVQFDGTNSATNLILRYDDGDFGHTYAPIGNVTITSGVTRVGARKIGNTIQALVGTDPADMQPVGPLVVTAGEYTGGTVGDCSVGIGTVIDDIDVRNATSPPPSDTENPTVVIDLPDTGTPFFTVESEIDIEAEVADNTAVTSCTLTNSQAGTTPLTPSSGRVSETVTLTQGLGTPYTLTITCLDAANNSGSDVITINTSIVALPQKPGSLRVIF